MILLSHPTANTTARHVARALSRAGVLGEFWTCSNEHRTPELLPITPAVFSETPAAPGASLPSFTWRDAVPRSLWRRLGERSFNAACRSLDRTVSTRLGAAPFKGVFASEDGAEESFRAAGRHGLLRIYDLPGGHWEAAHAICHEESALEPEWAATLTWPRFSPRVSARKDAELHQADLVVVGSSYLLSTLERVPTLPATVAVVPPGTPAPATPSPPAATTPSATDKLRVLFVGALGQSKGLSYLFRACRELRPAVTLTLIGSAPPVPCPALERELREVRWLPVCSADELRAEMAAHDVLLSPSLFDGFDPVLLDAMSAGLPVIATPHTAAPDLLDDGVEGFIVPIRSPADIIDKLELLRREPDRRAEMSANARRRAHRHSWENYERAVAASVATALAHR